MSGLTGRKVMSWGRLVLASCVTEGAVQLPSQADPCQSRPG